MSFSSYLVGTWERRFGLGTTIQIVNPTLDYVEVLIAFLDDKEECLKTMKSELSPNDIWEIPVPKLKKKKFGVVKVISHRDHKAELGIVGFQRHILAIPKPVEIAFSEAPLAAIPKKYAQPELERLLEKCPH
ncbi:hypothetical protein [Desulfogranum marinum]|uniref:hypothetical protein n=1 Tax=Desulfogranum marinum TaxID=453220 RepID=UPI001966961C|nr:hypothetical protein [Desulfogranum marinum]MBM9512505.1 hypothetical protein [Desulfogranum marinum]